MSFLVQKKLYAQETMYFVGSKAHYGFIIPHSPELKPVSNTNPVGGQLEISRLRTSDAAWKTCNCYGKTGFSFVYFNYNNPQVLGSSYNLNYFVEPYFTYTKRLKFSMRGLIGVSYLSKVFDEEDNPENVFFSAPISFFLSLGLGLNYSINKKWSLNLVANYNHISNAGQKQPNKGMNFPTFSVGVDRVFNHIDLIAKPPELKAYSRAFTYYAGGMLSFRSSDIDDNNTRYPLIGVLGGAMKPFSGINGVNAGLEFWYNGSSARRIEKENLDGSPFFSAVTLGHHFKFGNIYIVKQLGAYFIRPTAVQNRWLYQRYSIWYRFARKWAVSGSLIAYGHVADHMDGRLVFMF